MRRSAKSKQSDAFTALDARNADTAKPNNARTEQRSRLSVLQLFRQGVDKVPARYSIFPITSINRIAGEYWCVAKIFHPMAAKRASAVHAAEPRNSDSRAERQPGTLSLYNLADNLVSGNQWPL